MKLVATTGAVWARLRVSTSAYSSSFQEKMKLKMAETAIPGAARGRPIRQKNPKEL